MLFTKDNPKINYDSKYDVMSYIMSDTSNSYGDEDVDNIVTLKDIDTDAITGYTILNFKRICSAKSEEYDILSKLFDVQKVLTMCK